jgi:hypothetical protein
MKSKDDKKEIIDLTFPITKERVFVSTFEKQKNGKFKKVKIIEIDENKQVINNHIL